MTTEWFDRVTEELQDHLNSICEQYDQVGHMNINRASKHPRIEFLLLVRMRKNETIFALYFLTLTMKNFMLKALTLS